jgi:short-subunit dehydrogenase
MTNFTLITGASSGLGKDFALEYAKAKQNLILVARRKDRLDELAETCRTTYNVQVEVFAVDLSKEEAVSTFLDNLDPSWFIDRLINNAGFGWHGSYEDSDPETLTSMIDVNVKALSVLAYHVIPAMKANRQGEILNVASMAAFTPGPYMTEYYATKAYVLSFSMALREELKPYGIKVAALCPGPVHTEFFKVAANTPNGLMGAITLKSLPVVRKAIRGLARNHSVTVPGLPFKLGRVAMKLVPRSISAKLIANVQKTRG